MGLRQLLRDNVAKSGYKKPTPIQKYAIPIIMNKRDLMACAQTGSGKTAAFLLPILHNILEDECDPHTGDAPQKPQAVVVAPTRELALQIKEEARKFALQSVAKAVVAYGGTSTGYQLTQLFKGCNVLIATPGRLMDFVEKGKVSFEDCRYLVLDEADRMLDMGFEPQVRKIVSQIRPDRQTLMWSATWPREVQKLARDICKEDPVHINVGALDLRTAHTIRQYVEVVQESDKRGRLKRLLEKVMDGSRILIFAETKRGSDQLTREMRLDGWPALCIHGDKKQEERDWVLQEFKSGKSPILVATDVAARGLDVKDIKFVINYDFPGQIEDYIHRVGRTGRAGQLGSSYSFFTADKFRLAKELIHVLQEANQPVPQELEKLAEGGHGSYGGGGDRRRYN